MIVGAGPAGLACALHLSTLLKEHANEHGSAPLQPDDIYLIEKAEEVGMHNLSGAVIDPVALRELIPGLEGLDTVLDTPVVEDRLYLLGKQRTLRLPWHPAALRNEGNYVVSIGRLVRCLAGLVESVGVNLFTGIAGSQLLIENDRVVGIQTDDKGLDRQGKQKSNFEPGIELRSSLTVLAEGSRGSLTRDLIERFNLDDGCNEQTWSLGLKELWQLPPGRLQAGSVWHTMGFPLGGMYGGGWVYGQQDDRVSLGLVTGLHYTDPSFDPYQALQRFKTQPLMAALLDGGERIHYGAKTVVSGGYWAMPRAATTGALLVGDGAGLVNARRLKGIHLALKSGMLAAEAIFDSLLKESAASLDEYPQLLRKSWLGSELWKVRNFHQAFEHGLLPGIGHMVLQDMTGGRGLHSRYVSRAGHKHFRPVNAGQHASSEAPVADGVLTFDRSTNMFYSGTRHEEDQPGHLRLTDPDICNDRCSREYGNPCQYFCPAGVYEMVSTDDSTQLTLHPSNCLHCKTCDIMDPYQIVTWVPPEGGGGPRYDSM